MMCTCRSRPHTFCIEKRETCMVFVISMNRGLANQLARDRYNGIPCLHPQELEKMPRSLEKGGSEDPKQPEYSNAGCFANRTYTICTSAMRLTNERMAPHNRTSRARSLPSPHLSERPCVTDTRKQCLSRSSSEENSNSILHRSLLRLLFPYLQEIK